MKSTFKYIVSAFAVFVTLVSCQKDNLTGNAYDKPSVGNARVIEVHFGTATKSTLEGDAGFTPLFSNGDKIMVSNGTSKEELSISVDKDGNATFITNLTGALTAVYPSAAAKLNDNAIDGVIVPAAQDGTFAKANIAKATIASDATSATFENQTSLLRFYVDESIGVKSITITADANIADGSKTIVVDPEEETTLDKVTDDPGKRICYVSVLPGTFTSLKFTSLTTTQTDYKDNTVERIAVNVTLVANKRYNAFIPYYIDLGTAGKWGYCNVGAFLPEDAGRYFAWGETNGHVPDTDNMEFNDEYGIWENAFTFGTGNGGFAADFSNCPYCSVPDDDGEYPLTPHFTKYTTDNDYQEFGGEKGEPDNLTVLEAVDDAATVNWGNGWRMPTYDEFKKLYNGCNGTYDRNTYASEACGRATTFNKGAYWCENYDEVAGCLFSVGSNKLFFPAAGFGEDTIFAYEGYNGCYWSRSRKDTGLAFAHCMEFYPEDEYYTDGIYLEKAYARYIGYSIRPVKVVTANNPNPTETDPEQTVF